MTLKNFSLGLIAVMVLSAGCSKTNVVDDPPPPPPPPPPVLGKPNGILFVNGAKNNENTFYRINTWDSSVTWQTPIVNAFGSAECPKVFDSATFYHGNSSGVTAYSMQTGVDRWRIGWPMSSEAFGSYQEPAIKDSLIYLSSATSVGGLAKLYCCSKRTGSIKWQVVTDNGNYSTIAFNTTPLIYDDGVIVMTKDAALKLNLTSFRAIDGVRQWTTPIIDSLWQRLTLKDGKIYATSISSQYLYCYSANNGAFLWRTNLQGNFRRRRIFFDQENILVINEDASDGISIAKINLATGNLTSRINIPFEPSYRNCDYVNNTLYVSWNPGYDTIFVKALDLSTLAIKWKQQFLGRRGTYSPLLTTDKFCIVPIANSNYPNVGMMHFLDLNGNQITQIPLSSNNVNTFTYIENGITYKRKGDYLNQ